MALRDLKVDLTPGLKKLDVFSRRDILSRTMGGEWSTTLKGRGIEFAGFREYSYGDDASLIDWKASLRSKSILIREFEDFKNFTVFILFDISDTMLFSSHEKLKCEFAAELIYVLADAINQAGDAVGMAMFNDTLINTILPNIGAEVIRNIKMNLLDKNNYGGNFDLKKALLMTRSYLSSKAVIIIVSDFIGMDSGWEQYIQMLSGDFELIAFMVRDPRDRELPDSGGQFMVKNPLTGQNLYIDVSQYAKLYSETVKKRELYIRNMFMKHNGDFLLIDTSIDYMDSILKFFQRRSKRQD